MGFNPLAFGKVKGQLEEFGREHPRFAQFLGDIFTRGIEEDSIIEISVKRPDGSSMTTNMRVKASDIELMTSLKEIRP